MADVIELAQEIYVGMAVQAGPDNWEWDEIAQAAFNAAGRFIVIQQQQATTPTTPVDAAAVVTPAMAVTV